MTAKNLHHQWSDALRESDASAPFTAVLHALAGYANYKTLDGARPGASRLARETRYSLRTVRNALAFGEKAEWIEQTHKGGVNASGASHASTYKLTLPTGASERSAPERHAPASAAKPPRSKPKTRSRDTVSDFEDVSRDPAVVQQSMVKELNTRGG